VELLRQGRVYLEYSGIFYLLHTTKDVTFSQTFQQSSIPKRTLHSVNDLFSGSSIKTANPADFTFTNYLVNEVSTHQNKPLELLLGYNGASLKAFNLYFVYADYSPAVYYKIENCVFTNVTFNMPAKGMMTVTFSGQGTKLTRVNGVFPGSDSSYDSAPVFQYTQQYIVTISGDILPGILGVSLELQNNISWIKNSTVHNTLLVTNSSNTIFQSNFVINDRVLGGNVTQYIDEVSKDKLMTWQENTPVRIQAGLIAKLFDINLPYCSFTNRPVFGDLFSQSYDFRLMQSPNDLTTYFTY